MAPSDLRESASIEQDVDMVVLLHCEAVYEDSPRAGEADLILAKHRNGPTDTITVAFQGHYSRSADMASGNLLLGRKLGPELLRCRDGVAHARRRCLAQGPKGKLGRPGAFVADDTACASKVPPRSSLPAADQLPTE